MLAGATQTVEKHRDITRLEHTRLGSAQSSERPENTYSRLRSSDTPAATSPVMLVYPISLPSSDVCQVSYVSAKIPV